MKSVRAQSGALSEPLAECAFEEKMEFVRFFALAISKGWQIGIGKVRNGIGRTRLSLPSFLARGGVCFQLHWVGTISCAS